MHAELFDYLSQYITLTEAEKTDLMQLDVIREFKKDTVLLAAGEISNRSYFVLKGCVRVYYLIDGEERTTGFYAERHAIIPQTSITQSPSEYYLVCVEDSILSVGTPDMEETFFKKHPKFESLCRVMAEQMLHDKQMSFDRYMLSSPEQRYLHLLENNGDLINRVPQYQLASYIGVKPETLSRIRKRLTQK